MQYPYLWFQTDSPMQLNTSDIIQVLFTCSNHRNNFRPFLSNFFGESKEFRTKLQGSKLLQWVCALSVDAKSFCD